MKRIIAFLLCVAMALCTCGCAEYEELSKTIQEAARAVDTGSSAFVPVEEESVSAAEQTPQPTEPQSAPLATEKPEEPEATPELAKTEAEAVEAEKTESENVPSSSTAPTQISKTPTERILADFSEITKIPRASHHEEAISEYLYAWGLKNGMTTVKDESGNVIIDVPASTGCENAPLTVLQAHMDMVAVAESGKAWNILRDGLELKREGNILRAEGTSLGADDGLGLAAAMYALSDEELSHGPLRAIFTVNEEDGMSGAEKLDAKYVSDAAYLINLDNENVDQAIIGCAFGSIYSVNFTPAWKAPEGDTAYEISVSELTGGHSGICINMGRANAIKIIAGILAESFNEGVMPEIAEISGGTANNAIPDAASVTVVIRDADAEAFESIVAAQHVAARERYGTVEKSAVFNCSKLNTLPSKVLYGPVGRSLTEFLFLCLDGVNTMSISETDTVESSSNVGLLKLEENELSVTVYTRSSKQCIIEEQEAKLKLLCSMSGCAMRQLSEMPGWTPDPSNPLSDMAAEIYQVETGKEMRVQSVHAGLECGWLVSKNPKLQCVSIGPTIHEPHTTRESAEVDSIATFVKVLHTMLERISAE